MPRRSGRAPVLGMHDQAADLGGTVVGVARCEARVEEVPVEGGAVLLLVANVEVDVRHAAAPELRDDHRGADRACSSSRSHSTKTYSRRRGFSISPRNERSECNSSASSAAGSSGRLTVLR